MKKEIQIKRIEKKCISEEEKNIYLEKLDFSEKTLIPFIVNTYHLSNVLGIKWERIKNIINDKDKMYYNFPISKKRGGKRLISMPSQDLKIIQTLIKEKILEKVKVHDNAYGFINGKSIKENAEKHLNQEVLLNIDLENFFPSIHRGRVYFIFKYLCNFDNDLAFCLTELTTYKNALPQGAPTSPILSNIVAYMLDVRLSGLAKKNKIIYTRYADDITFSGNKDKINNKLLYSVTKIIEDCGFKLNENKTRFSGKHRRQEVTGLIVNNDVVTVSKKYIKDIRQELYYIKKFGVVDHRRKVGFKNKYYKDHILGKIMFINEIDKNKAKKLLQQFNEINWDDF